MPHFTLSSVIAKLVAIEHAGQLADLEIEIAEQLRGPADPLERYPAHKYSVERFARICSRLTGLPYFDCKKAAIEAVLPTTRPQVAIATIDEYHKRLQEQ